MLDFDYAYGQIKLDEDTKNLCIITVTGGEFTGYYRFLNCFYGLADIPNNFSGTDRQNIGIQTRLLVRHYKRN